MYLIGGVLLIPVSLLAYVSGIALGYYSKWGVFRYRWVLVKFVLTSVAVVLVPLSLLPGLRELSTLGAGVVSTSMYVTCAVLSVLKPWGRTPRVG